MARSRNLIHEPEAEETAENENSHVAQRIDVHICGESDVRHDPCSSQNRKEVADCHPRFSNEFLIGFVIPIRANQKNGPAYDCHVKLLDD